MTYNIIIIIFIRLLVIIVHAIHYDILRSQLDGGAANRALMKKMVSERIAATQKKAGDKQKQDSEEAIAPPPPPPPPPPPAAPAEEAALKAVKEEAAKPASPAGKSLKKVQEVKAAAVPIRGARGAAAVKSTPEQLAASGFPGAPRQGPPLKPPLKRPAPPVKADGSEAEQQPAKLQKTAKQKPLIKPPRCAVVPIKQRPSVAEKPKAKPVEARV